MSAFPRGFVMRHVTTSVPHCIVRKKYPRAAPNLRVALGYIKEIMRPRAICWRALRDHPVKRRRESSEASRSSRRICLERLPTILRSGPYRMFFYSADQHEPPHIHVERDDSEAKFWLDPVRLEGSRGFRRAEIRQIEDLIRNEKDLLLRGIA